MRIHKPGLAALVAALIPPLAACQSDAGGQGGMPYAKEVAAVVPAIESALGLKFRTPPRVELRNRDDVRAFLEKKFNEQQPALELAGAERAYKLFGFLPDTLDLRSYLLRLLAEQVVGYYDPATKVLYVVSGDGSSRGATSPEVVRITLTHELVHALQDQHLGLDSLEKMRGDNDRQTAAQAVIEGQATYEQIAVMLGGGNFMTRLPGGWDRVRESIREAQSQMPIFSGAPLLIQETLLFPYLSGAEFVRAVKERRPGTAPWQPLPVSTRQVMHPDRFLSDTSGPMRVVLPAPTGATVVYENNLGEFETRLLLFQWLQDVASAARGADGWDGDRYYVVNTPRGAGLTWLSVWGSNVEAAEFRDLLDRAMEARTGAGLGAAGRGEVRRFTHGNRTIEVMATTVQGRSAVLYTDVPVGAPTRLLDLAKVRLEKR